MVKITPGLMVVFLLTLSGCAKLPLDNSAPSAPEISTEGTPQVNNVAVQVLVDDPDGDRVTLKFRATHSGGSVQEFSWTSFIDSGKRETFYLGLGSGQWTLSAQAKDELAEVSSSSSIDITVGF